MKKVAVLSLAAGAAGIASGAIAAALAPELLMVAIAVGAVAFVALGFAGFSFHRSNQANQEFLKWEDPTQKIIQMRNNAKSSGFNVAFYGKSKGVLLTPEEVKSKWENEMKRHQEIFTSDKENDFIPYIKKFFEQRLLTNEKVQYAFEGQLPEHVPALIENFMNLENNYQENRDRLKEALDNILDTQRNEITRLRSELENNLAPHKQQIEKQRAAAKEEKSKLQANAARQIKTAVDAYDSSIKPQRQQAAEERAREAKTNLELDMPPGKLTPKQEEIENTRREFIQTIERDFNAQIAPKLKAIDKELATYEAEYQNNIAPILTKFDEDKKRVDGWAEIHLSDAHSHFDKLLGEFLQPIKEIFKHYKALTIIESYKNIYPDLSNW